MKNLFVVLAPSVLLAASTAYKVFHWQRFRKTTMRRQGFSVWYSSLEIMGTTSNDRRQFMEKSNRMTIAIILSLLFIIFAYFYIRLT